MSHAKTLRLPDKSSEGSFRSFTMPDVRVRPHLVMFFRFPPPLRVLAALRENCSLSGSVRSSAAKKWPRCEFGIRPARRERDPGRLRHRRSRWPKFLPAQHGPHQSLDPGSASLPTRRSIRNENRTSRPGIRETVLPGCRGDVANPLHLVADVVIWQKMPPRSPCQGEGAFSCCGGTTTMKCTPRHGHKLFRDFVRTHYAR